MLRCEARLSPGLAGLSFRHLLRHIGGLAKATAIYANRGRVPVVGRGSAYRSRRSVQVRSPQREHVLVAGKRHASTSDCICLPASSQHPPWTRSACRQAAPRPAGTCLACRQGNLVRRLTRLSCGQAACVRLGRRAPCGRADPVLDGPVAACRQAATIHGRRDFLAGKQMQSDVDVRRLPGGKTHPAAC